MPNPNNSTIMKSPLVLLCCFLTVLCSCSKSGSSDGSSSNKPAASAGDDNEAASDSKVGTFWELPDKADLTVAIAPWPPKAGSATLKANIDPNDDDQKFSGALEYRIGSAEQSSDPWQPMPRTSEDGKKVVYFEAPITLSAGSCYIQFRLQAPDIGGANKNQLELTDWKVEVK
jgi:hypothetical protein